MATLFQVKGIKPARLKIDGIRQALLDELRRQGEAAEDEFAKTVKTWNNPPSFDSIVEVSSQDASVLTGPTGDADAVQHFLWVDEGTQAHYVPKTGVSTMTFQAYKAKTSPGRLGSGAGGRHGPRITRRGRWRVGGITPRKFTQAVQKKRRKPFTTGMIAAMQRGADKAF